MISIDACLSHVREGEVRIDCELKDLNDDTYGVLHLDMVPRQHQVLVHNHVFKWTPSIARSLIEDANDLASFLGAFGITEMLATYPDNEHVKKWKKYIKLMGFEYRGPHHINGICTHVAMRRL